MLRASHPIDTLEKGSNTHDARNHDTATVPRPRGRWERVTVRSGARSEAVWLTYRD